MINKNRIIQEQILKEVEIIGNFTKAIDNALDLRADSILDFEKSNVVYVDFKILNEFKTLVKNPTELVKIIEIYHDWAARTFNLAIKNAGRLKKGKLREHIIQAREIISTISKVVPV